MEPEDPESVPVLPGVRVVDPERGVVRGVRYAPGVVVVEEPGVPDI